MRQSFLESRSLSSPLLSVQQKGFAGKFRDNIASGTCTPRKSSKDALAKPGTPRSSVPSFEEWRLEMDGMSGNVRVSEFADMRPVTAFDSENGCLDGYKRPANKRDLGHRCKYCRQPFSSLGSDLVAGPEQGPTQRFHLECWRKHNCNESKPTSAPNCRRYRCRSETRTNCTGRKPVSAKSVQSSAGGKVTDPVEIAAADVVTDCVTAYADEWKRRQLEPSRRTLRQGSRHSRKSAVPRTSPLDGLVSVEDENGERHVARGFSKQASQIAEVVWKCTAEDSDECAVCLTCPEEPMRLPCGHSFCTDCVMPWLKRCSLCPLCRKDLHSQADLLTGSRPPPAVLAIRRRALSSDNRVV